MLECSLLDSLVHTLEKPCQFFELNVQRTEKITRAIEEARYDCV